MTTVRYYITMFCCDDNSSILQDNVLFQWQQLDITLQCSVATTTVRYYKTMFCCNSNNLWVQYDFRWDELASMWLWRLKRCFTVMVMTMGSYPTSSEQIQLNFFSLQIKFFAIYAFNTSIHIQYIQYTYATKRVNQKDYWPSHILYEQVKRAYQNRCKKKREYWKK